MWQEDADDERFELTYPQPIIGTVMWSRVRQQSTVVQPEDLNGEAGVQTVGAKR